MKTLPNIHEQPRYVYGEPKEKPLYVPEDEAGKTKILGPVELSPNDFAMVPVKTEECGECYHYILKSGDKWIVGESSNKAYAQEKTTVQKPAKKSARKSGSTRSRSRDQGADPRETGERGTGRSGGTADEAPETPGDEPSGGEN